MTENDKRWQNKAIKYITFPLCVQVILIQRQYLKHANVPDFILNLNCVAELLSERTHLQNECPAYITIQTLLLWKALSFLLCAAKHHWEHEQNTSKQDTNSCCCCCWLHGWMALPICSWFRGKDERQNFTNYRIHHTSRSDRGPLNQVSNVLLCAWLSFFRPPLHSYHFIVHVMHILNG